MVDIRRRGRTHCSRKKRVKSFKSGEVIIVSNAADSSRKIKWGGKGTPDLESGSLLTWQEQFQYSVVC